MFTEKVLRLFDRAKAAPSAQKAGMVTAEALLSAMIGHPEGRMLMERCTGMSGDRLCERFPLQREEETLLAAALPLDQAARDLLTEARTLAAQVPDRTHPGLIALRHLACALALSPPACVLLGTKALPRAEAAKLLTSWYDADAMAPELGGLSGRLHDMRAHLLTEVFGQDDAVLSFVEGLFNAEVTAAADTHRRGPRALFVFAGPPGVGKTFLAELGAAALKKPYRRFDMSSYSDHQAHNHLIGFSPSYQAAQPGALTGFVAEHPDAFLLFDEIEKAHLNTIQLFLQILDAGHLEDKFTSANVPFRDTVIIFTTNAGASLYDRPNETGINAVNGTFLRHTLLDALRTEKGHQGEPFFPPALCSRMATGYPLLFNHLGIIELERVARAELERAAGLVEQQYGKTVTFDPLLPFALVVREGADADARTVKAQVGMFVRTEIFKFSELYEPRRLGRILAELDTIHFALQLDAPLEEDAARVFDTGEPPRVLLVASDTLAALFREHVTEVTWLHADTPVDAMQLLAGNDADLVLLDIWLGTEPSTLTGTITMFDHAPLGAHALAGGQSFLQEAHQRLPHLPVYLLSLAADGRQAGSVDEALLLACIRAGGARGVVSTSFTSASDADPEWQPRRASFARSLAEAAQRVMREKRARRLTQEHKVLAFDTAPLLDGAGRRVVIRVRNLRLARAIAAGDAGELLEAVERPSTRFADVFGADAAKEALAFIVDWLRNPRQYAALGVRPPRGILLSGSPGTGKTMLARALAGESEAAFLVASGTDFVTIWQGSGPENVRSLFARARRYAPSIVFIDEIDAVGKKRVGGAGASRAEETTLNALLTEMDGFGSPTMRPVILLAATNLAEQLDEALRRRFDREIEVQPPDRAARAAFLAHELMGRKLSEVTKETVDGIAGRSAGMTVSDLKRVLNEAAVMAARKDSPLTDAVLEEAFEKMRMGEAGKAPDQATLERIARHEAGHALIGWLSGAPPVQVTILGRGRAGGYVEREAQEEKIIYTRAELERMIRQAMGGRAAEILYYGESEGLSTGVASDLQTATRWAEAMIREFGMSDSIGQVSVRSGIMDDKVSVAAAGIVRAELDAGLALLADCRDGLGGVVSELLAKNRLTRADLERILGKPS
jgi:ATP-dependent metalloprotease FtsH